jgi:glyoxylase-like metal-dependent hydrolase (beta-lactamase superfamily II)
MKVFQTKVGPMEVLTYLIYDEDSRDAVLIDPAGEEERLLDLVREHGVTLRYIANTHGHPDHTTGNGALREKTGAPVVMHALDDDLFRSPQWVEEAVREGFTPAPPADLRAEDGTELRFGRHTLTFLHTPGHTPGGCCLLAEGNLFTGDTLFCGAVGRTDLEGGSLDRLLESIEEKILGLPPETVVWPGHDYGEGACSTIGGQMEENPYITDFILDEES